MAEYCGVGVVLQGPGVGRRAWPGGGGRLGVETVQPALLLAAAGSAGSRLHQPQSSSAPPPGHSSTSRTANSLQIWVSDRRTAPQPRTPRRAETLQSCSAHRDLGRVLHSTTQTHGGFLRQVAVARDTA